MRRTYLSYRGIPKRDDKSPRVLLPGWHARDGFDEWGIVRDAKPYFDGHYQPRTPLLGYLDGSEPTTLRTQVALAREYGVDGFIFDWYWKNDQPEHEESLNALLETGEGFPFSLMWGYKTPRRHFPISSIKEDDDPRWVNLTVDGFKRMLDRCADVHFSRPEYIRIDGKPQLTMYYLDGLVSKLGKQRLADVLGQGREHLGGDLHLTGITTRPFGGNPGFDTLTGYNYLPDFDPKAPILQDYTMQAASKAATWNEIEHRSGIPYIPNVSCGWDATPRGVRKEALEPGMDFPWVPVVTGATPLRFGDALARTMQFTNSRTGIVHVCSWNEWSEGNYLEPDTKYRYGFLEEIKKRKR